MAFTSFAKWVFLRENEFPLDYQTQNPITHPGTYYKPDTVDRMAVMKPEELASFVQQRYGKLANDYNPKPVSWWKINFGDSIFDLLVNRRVLDVDPASQTVVWKTWTRLPV